MALELAAVIVVDPKIRFGKPIIQGTRIPVELVVGKLAGGMTTQEVTEEYGIIAQDIRGALSYTTGVMAAINGEKDGLE